MEKVKVWCSIVGEYCAFRAVELKVQFDITNDKQVGDVELKTIHDIVDNEDFHDGYIEHNIMDPTFGMIPHNKEVDGFYDFKIFDAILLDGKYYILF